MYPGLRPEPLYLFFASINKKFSWKFSETARPGKFSEHWTIPFAYKLLLIMSVNEANPSELEVLRQRIIDLEVENTKIKVEKAELEARDVELKDRIE